MLKSRKLEFFDLSGSRILVGVAIGTADFRGKRQAIFHERLLPILRPDFY